MTNAPLGRMAQFAGLIALVLALGFAPAPVLDALAFERSALLHAGQWWRLVSAHVVHLNPAHTLMNGAALVLVMALVHRAAGALVWWLVFGVLSVAVSALLLLLNPELARYVGASGVIHGLLVFGAIRQLRSRRTESVILLTGVALKLGWEWFAGGAKSSAALIGAPVITDAHLYGAIGGVLLAVVVTLASRPSIAAADDL